MQLYCNQLSTHLQKLLYPCYLLFGNDPFLLQESQNKICSWAKKYQFKEQFSITIDINTDWSNIFNICLTHNLFFNRQILILILSDGSSIQNFIEKKLLQMVSLLHKDLLLIIRGIKLIDTIKKNTWFKIISQKTILVNCITPDRKQLPQWIIKYCENINLKLDNDTCQLLCFYYEGNLLALSQTLKQLSLMYPDGKLTLSRVDKVINNSTYFTPFQWVNALISGNIKRALHILNQLRLRDVEPIILLRIIQFEILQLLMLKKHMSTNPLVILFDRNKIWQNRRLLITQALKRITIQQLQRAINLLVHIELSFKQNYNYNLWSDLSSLTLLLCGTNFIL